MPTRQPRTFGIPAAPEFDFCLHRQPVSAQSRKRPALEAWKSFVRDSAADAWPRGRPPLDGPVRLRVTVFCEFPLGDLDNLLKPIQDALQTVAYGNDRQIEEASIRRFNINGSFEVRYMSARLAMAFSDGRPFVHVEIWSKPDQEALR